MAKAKRGGKQASHKNTHGSGHGHGAKNNKSIVADSAFKALFGGRLDRYTVDPVYEWDEEIDRLVEVSCCSCVASFFHRERELNPMWRTP